MRTISSFEDLEQFGIFALTGEACGYGMRILCDVTERGKNLIEKYLGGNMDLRRDSSMNSGTEDDPHVASVMLTRDMVVPFGIFALLYTSTDDGAMVATLEGYYGGETATEYSAEDMERLREIWAGDDDSELRCGDMVYYSGSDSRLLIIEAVSLRDNGESVVITDENHRELLCPRGEIEQLESSLFQRKFEMHTCSKLGRIYKRSNHPGSKDRNLHAMSGRVQ